MSCHSNNEIIIDKEKIVGRWHLVNPQNSETVFTKTTESAYIDGRLMASYNYQIDDDNILTAIDKSTGFAYKYHITKLTNDSLILNFTTSDGGLKFVREK